MGDDIPNFKAAARSKHRQNSSQKDKSKYKAKQASNKQADKDSHQPKKPQIDLKTTVLNISAPELDEFSRREVASNWKKYEETDDAEENEQNSAYDFGELLQMPASVGGHFQFAAEKRWEATGDREDDRKYSKYFHLDTNILNCGLLTIPFYERQGYDKGMFSPGDIIRMNIEADTHKMRFEKFLRSSEEATTAVRQAVITPKVTPPVLQAVSSSKSAPPAKVADSVPTNSLEVSVQSMSIATPSPVAPEKAEIQQWLDDILDD